MSERSKSSVEPTAYADAMKSICIFLLCLLLAGCASTERRALITPLPDGSLLGASTTEQQDDIMEAAFRHMCQPEPVEKDVSHNVNQVHKVYFLSVGDSHDPSPEFLKRLSGLKAPVKSISEGEWKGFFIYDRVTGERGAAFYVKRITMISKDEADVEAVIDPGGGLSASGPIYHVSRKDGKWVVTRERLKWIS